MQVEGVSNDAQVQGSGTGPDALLAQTENQTDVQEVPEAPKEKVQDDFANRFSSLARKERALQEQAKKFKDLENEIKSYQEAKARAKTDPGAILESLGLTYDQITEYYLNGGKPTPNAEVLSLKEELEQFKQQLLEKEEQQKTSHAQQQIDAHKRTLDNYAKSNDYELITANGNDAIELVFETQVAYFNQHGKVLSEKEACDLVEEHFEKQVDRLLALNKIKNKVAPQSNDPAKVIPPTGTVVPTLNSNLAAKTQPSERRPMNDDESLKLAASLIKFV